MATCSLLNVFRGESSGNKKPFRKWYGPLGKIQSLRTSAPLLALTGTTTTATRKKIMHLLGLNYGTELVMSPNRKLVKLSVEKVKNDISKSFSWLCVELHMKGMSCSRTLVYVRDYNSCGQIYGYFMRALGGKAYWPTNAGTISCNRIIAM